MVQNRRVLNPQASLAPDKPEAAGKCRSGWNSGADKGTRNSEYLLTCKDEPHSGQNGTASKSFDNVPAGASVSLGQFQRVGSGHQQV
jgi:hypothetical protein